MFFVIFQCFKILMVKDLDTTFITISYIALFVNLTIIMRCLEKTSIVDHLKVYRKNYSFQMF